MNEVRVGQRVRIREGAHSWGVSKHVGRNGIVAAFAHGMAFPDFSGDRLYTWPIAQVYLYETPQSADTFILVDIRDLDESE